MYHRLILASVLVALTAPATAQTGNAQPVRADAKPASNAADPNKKVCRKVPVTGSLVRTERICMTASQWRQNADDSKDGLDGLGTRGSSNGG